MPALIALSEFLCVSFSIFSDVGLLLLVDCFEKISILDV